MELQTKFNPMEKNGFISTTTFGLTASAHAFDVLSNRLYTDKIGAVIRELSCNAYDSHVQAGKPNEPFTVKLPSMLDPTFYVEDTGIGMSADEVRTIFANYFCSTKQADNTTIGGLGLGCKSPFAYTDTFNIEATKDGETNLFVATIGEHGKPDISLVSSTPNSTKPNGVKVSLAVKENNKDTHTFVEKAEEKLQWFNPAPNVIGNNAYDPTDQTYIVNSRSDKWWLGFSSPTTTGSSYSYPPRHVSRQMTLIMGNVAYPIDVSQLFKDDTSNQAHSNRQYFRSLNNLHLEVPIGFCSIAASREGLSYDKKTVKILTDYLISLEPSITKTVTDKIKSVSTPFEQWEMFWKLRSMGVAVEKLNIDKDITHSAFGFLPIPALTADPTISCTKVRIVNANRTTQGYLALGNFTVKLFSNLSNAPLKTYFRRGDQGLNTTSVKDFLPIIFTRHFHTNPRSGKSSMLPGLCSRISSYFIDNPITKDQERKISVIIFDNPSSSLLTYLKNRMPGVKIVDLDAIQYTPAKSGSSSRAPKNPDRSAYLTTYYKTEVVYATAPTDVPVRVSAFAHDISTTQKQILADASQPILVALSAHTYDKVVSSDYFSNSTVERILIDLITNTTSSFIVPPVFSTRNKAHYKTVSSKPNTLPFKQAMASLYTKAIKENIARYERLSNKTFTPLILQLFDCTPTASELYCGTPLREIRNYFDNKTIPGSSTISTIKDLLASFDKYTGADDAEIKKALNSISTLVRRAIQNELFTKEKLYTTLQVPASSPAVARPLTNDMKRYTKLVDNIKQLKYLNVSGINAGRSEVKVEAIKKFCRGFRI